MGIKTLSIHLQAFQPVSRVLKGPGKGQTGQKGKSAVFKKARFRLTGPFGQFGPFRDLFKKGAFLALRASLAQLSLFKKCASLALKMPGDGY